MLFRFRRPVIGLAVAAAVSVGAQAARAGDDGAAPLWEGISSIVTPFMGFGKDEKPPIEYREYGKIVVPKSMDLPAPGAPVAATGGAWPVNQEIQRKKAAKEEEEKKAQAGASSWARRDGQSFPSAPVTVRASDQPDGALPNETGGAEAHSSSMLGNLNPLGWVGVGKSAKLGPEPDREWLTDPPKGYRAPADATSNGTANQATK